MPEHFKAIPKRFFKCNNCDYSVQVFGEQYFDYGCNNFMATFCCTECKILQEGIVSKRIWLTRTIDEFFSQNHQMSFNLADIEGIICLNCEKNTLHIWNKDTGRCPKCEGSMGFFVDGEIRISYDNIK